jgi:hypothetical protein
MQLKKKKIKLRLVQPLKQGPPGTSCKLCEFSEDLETFFYVAQNVNKLEIYRTIFMLYENTNKLEIRNTLSQNPVAVGTTIASTLHA